MAGTSGITATEASALLSALCPNAATGTFTYSVVAPLKVLFLSAIRTANNGSDTEWSTSGGYTAGTGFSGLTFAAPSTGASGATAVSNVAATITNAPAGTWAGCRVRDSTGTPKEIWYSPVSPSKTINAGDTVTVPSGSFTGALG